MKVVASLLSLVFLEHVAFFVLQTARANEARVTPE